MAEKVTLEPELAITELKENQFAINDLANFVLEGTKSKIHFDPDGTVHISLQFKLEEPANLQKGPGLINEEFDYCGVFTVGNEILLQGSSIPTLMLSAGEESPKVLLNADPQGLTVLTGGEKGRQGHAFTKKPNP